MEDRNKKGIVNQVLNKIVKANKEEHSPDSRNNARLGYGKGNIDQAKPKNTDVWSSCPVLDEQGKPISEDQTG